MADLTEEQIGRFSALKRIDTGTYGDCQDCGEPIGGARLDVRPEAFLCIGCQEEREGARS